MDYFLNTDNAKISFSLTDQVGQKFFLVIFHILSYADRWQTCVGEGVRLPCSIHPKLQDTTKGKASITAANTIRTRNPIIQTVNIFSTMVTCSAH